MAQSTGAVVSAFLLAQTTAQVPEPYSWLNGGAYSGPILPYSLDPLASYQWGTAANYSDMQIFPVNVIVARASNVSSVLQLDSIIASEFGSAATNVTDNCTIMIDFAVEHAAWLELSFATDIPSYASVNVAISEFDKPRPSAAAGGAADGKLVAYPGAQYRFETTKQLYDGLRYAWITVAFASSCYSGGVNTCAPLRITGVRGVAQVLPFNYSGFMTTSDPVIDRIYYQGAYSTRVNILPGFFGSELLSRGDRAPPFQGDAHVAQAVGLAAFGSQPMYALVRTMLNFTDSARIPVHDSNIVTYPLMWILSVCDYWYATGDAAFFAELAPSIDTILGLNFPNFASWPKPSTQRWSGWDDRLGSGFADVDLTSESRRFYWMTIIRAAAVFVDAATQAGGSLAPYVTKYTPVVQSLVSSLRNTGGPQWYLTLHGGYGLHAMAAAINGGWTTAQEQSDMFSLAFNDSAHICSFSNYDSGFILRALGVMGRYDFGMAMLRMCWGAQIASGATCWWESSDSYGAMLQGGVDMDVIPGATTSGCHAWGSYPTAWLAQQALGVTPTRGGYSTFLVSPGGVGMSGFSGTGGGGDGGSGYLDHISGTVPTPHGSIEVDVTLEEETGDGGDGDVTVTYRVIYPAGTTGTLRIPTAPYGSQAIDDINGCGAVTLRQLRTTTGDIAVGALPRYTDALGRDHVLVEGLLKVVEDGDRREVTVTAVYAASSGGGGGRTCGVATAPSSPWPYPPFTPYSYALPSPVIDNTTHGMWIDGGYGKQGYALFGFNSGGADVAQLPPYVAFVNVSSGATRHVVDSNTSVNGPGPFPSWLQDPSDPTSPSARRLGAADAGALFNLWVDIGLDSNQMYTLWVDVGLNGTSSGSGNSGAPRSLRAVRPAPPASPSASGTAAAAGAIAPFTLTLYVADTATPLGSTVPESVIVRAEDMITRNQLTPDVMARHYVAPPPYGNSTPPYNAGGLWGLEAGLMLRYSVDPSRLSFNTTGTGPIVQTPGVRFRVFCVDGCYASISGLFFDAAA